MDEKIIQSRNGFEKMGNNYPLAKDVKIDKEIIDTIECFWFRHAEKINTSKIVIYLHGGCFVLGSIRSHQALVSHFSKDLELPFLFIEYSLAPEKPYPNALNEILIVYKKLLDKYPESEFILMGDSAGAWLSTALISKIYELKIQPPIYSIMISPWIDLSCSSNSIIENAPKDPILKKERLLELASLYMENQDLSLVNPLDSINEKFPPTLILVGSDEILLDDSKSVYSKIVNFQPKVKLSIYDNQTHVWLLDDIHTQESQNAIKEIKEFVKT